MFTNIADTSDTEVIHILHNVDTLTSSGPPLAGTFVGCSAYLKEQSGGKVKSFLVEPATSTVMNPAGRTDKGGHQIQGGGYSKGEKLIPTTVCS